jgi:hypothetical protein
VVAPDRSGGVTGRWKASATANSTGYVSNIYRVEDRYESSFRAPGICSNGLHKTIREAERQRDVQLEFDPRRRLGRLEESDPSSSNASRAEQFAVPECVQDILSAVYYARTLPLTVGKAFDFPLNDGGKTIQIHVDVQAEEEIATEAGKFQTIRVEPDVFDGHLFKGKGRIWIWFTKDPRHLPVQLRAQIDVGTITATLAELGPKQ